MSVLLNGAKWQGKNGWVLLTAYGEYQLLTTKRYGEEPITQHMDCSPSEALNRFNGYVDTLRCGKPVSEETRKNIRVGLLRHYQRYYVDQLLCKTDEDLDAPRPDGYYYRSLRHQLTETIENYNERITATLAFHITN